MFKEVTQRDIVEFMKQKDNADLVVLLDQWFKKKIEGQDIQSILCLIQAISIFCNLAGKEIAELKAILNSDSGKFFYNA